MLCAQAKINRNLLLYLWFNCKRSNGMRKRLYLSHIGSHIPLQPTSVQFSTVTQSCLTLCNPMNCSTPGLPVHHQLLEFTQTHVHRVGDAIQPSHPLLSPSLPAPQSLPASGSFPMSQLFTWSSQSIGVAASTSVLPMNTQDWSPLAWAGWFTLATLRMREISAHWKADKLWITYLQGFEHLSQSTYAFILIGLLWAQLIHALYRWWYNRIVNWIHGKEWIINLDRSHTVPSMRNYTWKNRI